MSIIHSESSEPVTSQRQLVEYFVQAAKPRAEWLIGCEHEKFAYRLSTLGPVSYGEPNGIRALLEALREFGWHPLTEEDHIIGLSRGTANISLEPGGQVELSGAPFSTLHENAAEFDRHLLEINVIGKKLDLGFLGIGFHPTAKREDISLVPKARYRIQAEHMPKRGTMALDMMLRTCTVQVNLDYSGEADMAKKFRVALALQPIATALFASSPFLEGKPSGYLSTRMHVWQHMDPDRSGFFDLPFEDGFGFERYTDYALDVPMQFIFRNNRYIDCYGRSFRDFMEGRLPVLPGETPTISDWTNHLTTIFPDVRLKRVLEMRGADAGSAEMMLALPAFWAGLLYDADILDAAGDLIAEWTPEDRKRLHAVAPRMGLKAEIAGRKALDVASAALLLAQKGLKRRAQRVRGYDETRYLDPLFTITESGQSRADELLAQSARFRNFTMKNVFDACRLLPPPQNGMDAV